MDKFVLAIFFIIALFGIYLYIIQKRKNVEDFSFSHTFLFEGKGVSKLIKESLACAALFAVCSVIIYVNIYTKSIDNGYMLLSTIAAIAISLLFLWLNLVNLVAIKKHLFAFSLFAAIITAQSVEIGFAYVNAYKIAGSGVLYIVLAVLLFVKAAAELFLITPVFKFSFINIKDKETGEIKKPNFVRLAFYEWLYLFFFVLNTLSVIVLNMI